MNSVAKLNSDQQSVLAAVVGAMPPLSGSAKQVAWADSIRREMAAWACLTTFQSAIAKRGPHLYAEQMAAAVKGNANLQVADAVRWIEAQQKIAKTDARGRLDMMSVINGAIKL